MLFKEELAGLRAQREMLIARSDVQRSVLELEVLDIQSKLNLFQPAAGWARKAKSFMPFAAPLAGYFMAKNWRRILRWGGRYFFYKSLRTFFR